MLTNEIFNIQAGAYVNCIDKVQSGITFVLEASGGYERNKVECFLLHVSPTVPLRTASINQDNKILSTLGPLGLKIV